MTIEEKLNSIRETKEAIKTSIQNKGVEVADTDTFRSYAEKIDSIESGADLSEYFYDTPINSLSTFTSVGNWASKIKKIPALTNTGTTCNRAFSQFYGTEIDLSNFNTSSVTNMASMFYQCYNLTTLDLSNFDTSNVTNMYGMFNYCSGLTNLDLSSFNTSNVTSMNSMFYGCTNLTTLNIRNFNFTNVTNYTDMFGSSASSGVPDNCLIIVKDETAKTWITSKFSRLTNVKTVAEYEAQ